MTPLKIERLSPIEWKTLFGFAVALTALLTIGVMAILFMNQTKYDDRRVEHSHDVIEHLQSCLLAEREMEINARAYVLTGQEPYLAQYQGAVVQLTRSVRIVQELTTDNPAQQRRVTLQLRPLIDQRLAIASRVIIARQRVSQQAAIAILFQHSILDLINHIHKVIEEMQKEERTILTGRITEHDLSSQKLHSVVWLGSTLAIVFLVIASVLIHRDVRARQRVELELRLSEAQLFRQTQDLQATNKELEAFSYSVSHDLRAPLRGIEGFSELILANYKDRLDTEGQSYFDRICAAAKRMGILIDELLSLSRITRSPLKIQDVDLAALAQEIIAELRHADPSRQVAWKIPPSLLVRGDPSLLRVALGNLLSNAWKFTSKKHDAQIEIDQMNRDGQMIYYVKDNGAGFDMAYQNKLFQAFQRLHSPKEFTGTGIGLATVQRVIHRHGGRVWAEGSVDHGAIFYFTL